MKDRREESGVSARGRLKTENRRVKKRRTHFSLVVGQTCGIRAEKVGESGGKWRQEAVDRSDDGN